MTKIYGASDDLLEFEGDLRGEIGYYGSSKIAPIRVRISDGTEFEAYYSDDAIWKIVSVIKGSHFESLEECNDPDAEVYSDVLTLKPGKLKAIYQDEDDTWNKVD